MITDIEDFFTRGCGRCRRFDTEACSARVWRRGLAALREICLSAGLDEVVKWGQPCYMHAGRNIAIIGAFQDSFILGFFNAALMTDPDAVLERQGPNTQNPDIIRFTGNAQVAELEPTIRAYLQEAKGYAEEGRTPPKTTEIPELPEELSDALDADSALAEAFHALTPGRQRNYIINLSGAKKSQTRVKRIEKFRDKILAGKGALDR